MNIEQIKGNRYTPKKTGKSSSSSKTSASKLSSEAAGAGGKTKDAANVSLSESSSDDEITFARNLFHNIRQESLGSLKKIKQKINDGDYNSEDIRREVSSLVKNDLSTLTNVPTQSPGTDT